MINNQLQIFESQDFGQVRVILRDDQPWFVGKDVAERLGYSDLNKAVAMHVDVEDKELNDKTSPSFGQRGATIINESGLYSLILSSKLPQAKAFKRWVTSEVLPAIRSQGMYLTQPKATEALEDPAAFLAKAMQVAHRYSTAKSRSLQPPSWLWQAARPLSITSHPRPNTSTAIWHWRIHGLSPA